MTAEVYDLNSKKVWSRTAAIDLPEDGVVNDVFKIDFPANITPVHFIKLRLYDERGKEVSDNFLALDEPLRRPRNTHRPHDRRV